MGATVHEFLYGTHMGKKWSAQGLEMNLDVNRRLLDTATRLKAEGRLDLIFAVIYDDVLEVGTARALRALGVPMVNYHVDLVGQWYRVLRTGACFDRVACAQPDHWNGLKRAGIRPYYMPMAANPPLDSTITGEEHRFEGVTYLGSPWAYRRRVLAAIQAAAIPLRVYGHNWKPSRKTHEGGIDPSKAQPLRKNLHDARHYVLPRLREEGMGGLLESLRGRLRKEGGRRGAGPALDGNLMGSYRQDDFAALVKGAAINLGFTHFRGDPGTPDERRQVRLREFEIPMAGGFYLTQDCPQLRELFEAERTVAVWDQIPDLLEKVAYYLERPAERSRLATAAQAHCLAHHTWQRRFAGLLDELKIRTQ